MVELSFALINDTDFSIQSTEIEYRIRRELMYRGEIRCNYQKNHDILKLTDSMCKRKICFI